VSTAAPIQATCPRPHCGGALVLEWDSDLRTYEPKCMMCGRTPPKGLMKVTAAMPADAVDGRKTRWQRSAQTAASEAQPTSEAKEWASRVSSEALSTRGATRQVAVVTSPGLDALEAHATATRRYVDLSHQHQLAINRVRELAPQVQAAEAEMQAAREKLDAELTALGATRAPKPTGSQPKLAVRPCAMCSQLFQPVRENNHFCSEGCKEAARRKRQREWKARQGGQEATAEASTEVPGD
jgi:hypothetical protein